jgi:hypothetical protein
LRRIDTGGWSRSCAKDADSAPASAARFRCIMSRGELAGPRLGPTPPVPLHQQPRNDCHLSQQRRETNCQLPAVALPRLQFAKVDLAPRRQAAFADPPTLQLPPVEFRHCKSGGRRYDVAVSWAMLRANLA